MIVLLLSVNFYVYVEIEASLIRKYRCVKMIDRGCTDTKRGHADTCC